MRHAATIVMLVLGAALTACGDDPPEPGPEPTTAAPTAQDPGTANPSQTSSATPPPQGPAAMLPGRYQPLWPFADPAQVRDWQRAYRSGGTAPWHLDAEQTALSFTRGYLGFSDIDQVTSREVSGRDARIGVGYRTENGRTGTAAVLHLMRTGEGGDAPWEVVGSDDTTLELLSPPYASRVSSPVSVGGRITGVDESVRITIHQLGSTEPVGAHCCIMAGGQGTPWSAKVAFKTGNGRVLTIVASTGGHLKEVERFALTGVRP